MDALTPECIMAFLTLRMRDFDNQFSTQMREIRTVQDQVRALSSDVEYLSRLQTACASQDKLDYSREVPIPAEQREQFTSRLQSRLTATNEKIAHLTALREAGYTVDEANKNIDAELTRYNGDRDTMTDALRNLTPGGSGNINGTAYFLAAPPTLEGRLPVNQEKAEKIGQLITEYRDRISTLNNGNDLRMTQLQSVMQQRSSLVQMASNMLKSLDESNRSIINNLR